MQFSKILKISGLAIYLVALAGCSTDAGSDMSAKDVASLKNGDFKNMKKPPQFDQAMKGPADFHSSIQNSAPGAPSGPH